MTVFGHRDTEKKTGHEFHDYTITSREIRLLDRLRVTALARCSGGNLSVSILVVVLLARHVFPGGKESCAGEIRNGNSGSGNCQTCSDRHWPRSWRVVDRPAGLSRRHARGACRFVVAWGGDRAHPAPHLRR